MPVLFPALQFWVNVGVGVFVGPVAGVICIPVGVGEPLKPRGEPRIATPEIIPALLFIGKVPHSDIEQAMMLPMARVNQNIVIQITNCYEYTNAETRSSQ